MPHMHFIVNPVAGGNSCLHRFRVIEEILSGQGADFSVVYSERPGHASELARQALAAGCELVVAVGGDGTVREVAQEMVHTGVPMGILPCGTGNDVIRALNIPAEMERALQLLQTSAPRPVDAAEVNGRIFLNVSGFGFDVDVLVKTLHYKNRFHGHAAYLLGVLHALAGLSRRRVQIVTKDGCREEEVLLVAVGNGTHIGGGMMVTPYANMEDGLLDVCVIRAVNRMKVLHCLAKFIRGRHVELDCVQYFRAEAVEISGGAGEAVQLDGEIIEHLPATYRVLPGALQMITGLEAAQKAGAEGQCHAAGHAL